MTPSLRAHLVLDVGTTALKAMLFDLHGNVLGRSSVHLQKKHPRRGWVEQDPREYVTASVRALKEVCRKNAFDPSSIVSMGITNQRETTILWDERTGRPIAPAMVWEDHRTALWCAKRTSWNDDIRSRTGLSLEPYFSASKIVWMFQHIPVDQSRLKFGTVESWLMWNLCADRPHLTDETNASRTLLFNVKQRMWDEELLRRFDIPRTLLPVVQPSRSPFGFLKAEILGCEIPVRAVCGDQQSSLFAAMVECGSTKGPMTKVTYGTGTFIMQTIGSRFHPSASLYTTICPRPHGDVIYACEAKIERGGVQAEPLLAHPDALRRYLRDLAKRVDHQLMNMPKRPKEIVIDGGLTRDGLLARIQAEVSGVRVRTLATFDGTALGIARMLEEA